MPSLSMLVDWVRTQWAPLTLPKPGSLAGQTIIVVGANTGLGLEAVRHFVSLGASKVILTSRSEPKGITALQSVEKSTGKKGVVEMWLLDLANYNSIKNFAERCKSLDRIDVLLENAGVGLDVWTMAEGQEMTITVNVIGTFLLTTLLLPKLRQSARKHNFSPRVTIVSSGMHAFAKDKELKQDDIFAALADRKWSDLNDRYNVSKLLEVYVVREMAKLLPVDRSGVIINVMNPGLCKTELGRDGGFSTQAFLWAIRNLMARTAEQGARTLVHAAECGDESHGKFVSENEIKEHWVIPHVKTPEGVKMQSKVWTQLATQLEKIEPGCVARAMEV